MSLRVLPIGLGCHLLAVALSGHAQEFLTSSAAIMGAPDHKVLVLPTAGDSLDVSIDSRALHVRHHESANRRMHVVVFEGETFSASTPIEGPWSRIAFDPSRRAFVQLLPSIRVETRDKTQLELIVRELGAINVTMFDSLALAVIDLPDDMHPAEAVARVQAMPGRPRATIRLRAPRVEWR